MGFSRLLIHFRDNFFKIVILWPIPNPSFLAPLAKKGQNRYVMKHSDKENVYEPNLNIMTPLTQNWVKKDLNL